MSESKTKHVFDRALYNAYLAGHTQARNDPASAPFNAYWRWRGDGAGRGMLVTQLYQLNGMTYKITELTDKLRAADELDDERKARIQELRLERNQWSKRAEEAEVELATLRKRLGGARDNLVVRCEALQAERDELREELELQKTKNTKLRSLSDVQRKRYYEAAARADANLRAYNELKLAQGSGDAPTPPPHDNDWGEWVGAVRTALESLQDAFAAVQSSLSYAMMVVPFSDTDTEDAPE